MLHIIQAPYGTLDLTAVIGRSLVPEISGMKLTDHLSKFKRTPSHVSSRQSTESISRAHPQISTSHISSLPRHFVLLDQEASRWLALKKPGRAVAMDQVEHIIIDPGGEVTIELRNANPPFAEWAEEIITSASEQAETEGVDTKEDTDQERCFSIQVSAKHLLLASPVFKKLLSGGWKENITFLQKGSVTITAESWDTEALLIMLRAMHCQHNSIPRTVTLEMLAKVAVLVDYYKCKEAVGIYADIWIKALKDTIPDAYSRELILWLWISWFYGLSAEFRQVTSTAMSRSNGLIDSLGLPIPDKIIESMNKKRQRYIDNKISSLHEKHVALISGKEGCSFECSSIMGGALARQMHSMGLFSPRPVSPFLGFNFRKVVKGIFGFQSPKWFDSSPHRPHSCRHTTFESIGGKSTLVPGYDLDQFIS